MAAYVGVILVGLLALLALIPGLLVGGLLGVVVGVAPVPAGGFTFAFRRVFNHACHEWSV